MKRVLFFIFYFFFSNETAHNKRERKISIPVQDWVIWVEYIFRILARGGLTCKRMHDGERMQSMRWRSFWWPGDRGRAVPGLPGSGLRAGGSCTVWVRKAAWGKALGEPFWGVGTGSWYLLFPETNLYSSTRIYFLVNLMSHENLGNGVLYVRITCFVCSSYPGKEKNKVGNNNNNNI